MDRDKAYHQKEHYEQKMAKLREDSNKLRANGKMESNKAMEKVLRNERKNSTSQADWERIDDIAKCAVERCLSNKYQDFNPAIVKVFELTLVCGNQACIYSVCRILHRRMVHDLFL